MNAFWKVMLFSLLIAVCAISCKETPSMLMGNFARTPADLVDPEYRNGNEYDHQLIWGVEAVLKENRGFAPQTYKYLIRGQRPDKYSFKEYKKLHPNDLVIHYGNGKKLAIFTNDTPTPDMQTWGIVWDANPPKLPQRIR
ncbi:hypothetical protein HGA34_01745 [Candidatus Falkowbacteria bacterium]|nr:hypothetical protein [Candidatus Falkowbacteria bacterium]